MIVTFNAYYQEYWIIQPAIAIDRTFNRQWLGYRSSKGTVSSWIEPLIAIPEKDWPEFKKMIKTKDIRVIVHS